MSCTQRLSAEYLAVRRAVAASDAVAQVGQPTESSSFNPHLGQHFMGLIKAYRRSGGLLRAQDAAARCKPRGGTDVPTLAGWMVHRQVVCIEWLSRIWLPVFQFNRADMSRQSGLDEVMSELVEVYDNWQMARWFSQPNPRLGHARPADRLALAAADVLRAARAERFGPTVAQVACY